MARKNGDLMILYHLLPEIAVDALQASATVPEDLEILAVQTALVPSDGQYETLCHEFKCAAAGAGGAGARPDPGAGGAPHLRGLHRVHPLRAEDAGCAVS